MLQLAESWLYLASLILPFLFSIKFQQDRAIIKYVTVSTNTELSMRDYITVYKRLKD